MIKHIILWNFQEGKGSEEDKLKIILHIKELGLSLILVPLYIY